jgi:uncharacterized membrane protein
MTAGLLLANIGVSALYLLFAWLLSAIAAAWLAVRAGFPERAGLAAGLLLTVVGAIAWLVIYVFFARENSPRKVEGLVPRRRRSVPEG